MGLEETSSFCASRPEYYKAADDTKSFVPCGVTDKHREPARDRGAQRIRAKGRNICAKMLNVEEASTPMLGPRGTAPSSDTERIKAMRN